MKAGLAHKSENFAGSAPLRYLCPIILEEKSGVGRDREPVRFGIPFPIGLVLDPAQIVLLDQGGNFTIVQVQILSRWNDGSVQWALLEFFATVRPFEVKEYSVNCCGVDQVNPSSWPSMIHQESGVWVVDTGKVRFVLNPTYFTPFNQVFIDDSPCLNAGDSHFILTDDQGKTYRPRISTMGIEVSGPIRTTFRVEGSFSANSRVMADYIARLSFYRESGFVELTFTLRNSRPACHPGGLWDLGDAGSVFFKDLTLQFSFLDCDQASTKWNTHSFSPLKTYKGETVKVYQDSSGGKNWNSTNHVNRFGQVMNLFSGYRMMVDEAIVEEGDRSNPGFWWGNGRQSVAATIEEFWQNFPKSLEGSCDQLNLRLFPHHYSDVFELQGGEQKTHTLFLQFGEGNSESEGLDWVHSRLMARSVPEWYAQTKAISYLLPRVQDKNAAYVQLIDCVITGTNTFFDRREIIDEYGWRNFGEVYADHESVGHKGTTPRVSHYNNQYDVINGLGIEFLRTGDSQWYRAMVDLAHHVIDIDIYHTQEDQPAYNGGMFWHTDHYFDASTATHRTFSKTNQPSEGGQGYGGGPSNEHNYTSGLLLYYFLTGDPLAYEAVQGLADWVINMDQGRCGLLGFFDRRPRGLASATYDRAYHGPGRGGGNSVNALIDAHQLTKDEKYLLKAEELIRRCIHPNDQIESRNLENIEARWSYLVFLQVLGKFLDYKTEKNNLDYMFEYARASLLHYSRWMVQHEVPYKQVLDRVEIPTETWSAQDIRKHNVFHFAAKYAEESERLMFQQKAEFFFSRSVSDLLSFKTYNFTRPLVLMLVNGYMHSYFQENPNLRASFSMKHYDFGRPWSFTPQLNGIYKLREWVNRFRDETKQMLSSLSSGGGKIGHG